ncbi:MAG: aldehyde dehydrogenase family protein [Bacillota bacterium]|nr:aldehyde dehydrogenase family protein [Bacillota bacterium]
MENNILQIEREIDRIFNLQMNYKWRLRETTAKYRIEKLKRLYTCIMKYKEEIVKAIYADFKKPEEEILLTEIFPVTSEIKHIIRHLNRWMRDKRVRTPLSHFGARCKIRHEPRGVSLIMSPWNFPFQLTIDPLVSAIAAGNCVMVKPSEFTPATTTLMKKMLSEVFDESEIAVFEGDYTVSQYLLEKPFDNIFFTGSPAVGKIVMEAAAKHLTTVTLELGGKSPVIVDASADLDMAAKRVAWGKCLNAGQICVAPDYLFIPESRKEEFVKLLNKYITSYYGSMEKPTEELKYCRIITPKHFNRITGLIDEAVSKGAKISFGGHYEENDRFISPTVLTNIPSDSKVLEEEIFGPVLPIVTYKHINEALEYINSKPKPLALYIFSRDSKATDYILTHTESGDAVLNDVVVHVGNTNLPFGGFNNSGIGKTHGYHGFMAFTHERSYLKQAKVSAVGMFYPPFKASTKSIIGKLIKYL